MMNPETRTTLQPAGKSGMWSAWASLKQLQAENAALTARLGRAERVAQRCETMLREGDHRIKNSLQIIASLVDMQARREPSETASAALRATGARIRSVALIHDALQVSGGEDAVDLGATLEDVCRSLRAMAEPSGVTLAVRVEPIRTPVAFARAISLAVNELVVNALRHGFPADRAGAIQITLAQSAGRVRVSVVDNGCGLPDGFGAGRGYGLTLVRSIAEQIDGVLDIGCDATGAHFSLSAPTPAPVCGPALSLSGY